MKPQSVDLMYLAWNRLEFTRETFSALLENTDWQYVNELFVYDDGSTDGTREWLQAMHRRCPSRVRFLQTHFGSPVAAQNDFIRQASAPWLAKIDNDAVVPPAWLRQSIEVVESHPELSMLGIEAMYPHVDDTNLPRSYTAAQFVSGLGLYRRSVFANSLPRPIRKWFGLEEWQMARRHLKYGWITPAIPVFLLDRFPFDPWKSHSDRYVQCGWQRSWPNYDPACTLWHWRWPQQSFDERVLESQELGLHLAQRSARNSTFSIVILSACAQNLVPCVNSILENEPGLSPEDIVVVDDGARQNAGHLLPGVRWVDGSKPFIYARNANLGIAAAGRDIVLLNDDARLVTRDGFTTLAEIARRNPAIGLLSAGVRGVVGNPNQVAADRGLHFEPRVLAFVCVFLPRSTYQRVGPLDERFTGYGYEDNDYCLAVSRAGLKLAITDACIVDHSGFLHSTFRSRPDVGHLAQTNLRLFNEKHGVALYGRQRVR
jgi:GT2 family glycosyltransferase